jgi:hypothetical protein
MVCKYEFRMIDRRQGARSGEGAPRRKTFRIPLN